MYPTSVLTYIVEYGALVVLVVFDGLMAEPVIVIVFPVVFVI